MYWLRTWALKPNCLQNGGCVAQVTYLPSLGLSSCLGSGLSRGMHSLTCIRSSAQSLICSHLFTNTSCSPFQVEERECKLKTEKRLCAVIRCLLLTNHPTSRVWPFRRHYTGFLPWLLLHAVPGPFVPELCSRGLPPPVYVTGIYPKGRKEKKKDPNLKRYPNPSVHRTITDNC